MIPNNSPFSATNYKIVNLTLAGIILCVFIYSGLFSPTKQNHPIPSIYTQITGEPSPSTGLSQSFSAIIRGDFSASIKHNQYGLQIFFFFAIQLIFRIGLFLLTNELFSRVEQYIYVDIVLSILGFLLAFRPLIFFTFKLFEKTVVN